jgi:anti-anti-sigma factor
VRDQAGGCPVRWHGDQAVVTLPEQMDVSNAGQVREELLWVINRGAAALVVDMTATISCDHAGADAVARAYQRAVVSGTGMRLAVTAQIVRRVLSLSGLDRLVSIYPSLEAAMAVTAPAARTPLALVGSLAGNGAGGRQASRPPAEALPGRGGPAGPPPASDTAITPALIREMVESFPDGVALADGGGVITLASRRLEDMFGYGHAELADSSIERLVPSDLQAAHRGHRAGYARAPAARPMGAGALLAGLRKDGTTFPVEISLSPLATPAGQFTIAVVRDLTRARQLEELGGLATAAAAADTAYRHGELLDTIVTRLFSAGLTLQSAASQAPGAAADAIDAAASKLEDVIRDIRDTVFTADTTEPRA